jgi:LuxR family maltose regulon positive regulatory protein
VTSYLVEHSAPAHPDPFTERLIVTALEVRAAQPDTHGSCRRTAEPLTAAELRVLKLLPTSTYPQIAAALYISRSTVKTHLQSVYHKLGVASRADALERAVDLRLL